MLVFAHDRDPTGGCWEMIAKLSEAPALFQTGRRQHHEHPLEDGFLLTSCFEIVRGGVKRSPASEDPGL